MDPKVSGLIIAKNEAEMLPRCIQSMRKVCQNIFVLVDQSTTDNTVDVLHKYGCRFALHPFANWRDQRNKALDLSNELFKEEWILFLDADEYLSDKLTLNIPRILDSTESNKIEILAFCRANYQDGDGPRGWPDLQPRLIKRHVRFDGPLIHEHPVGFRVDLNEQFGGNIGHIIHDKTRSRQKIRNRQYYLFEPSVYKTCPDGCEDIWKEPK